MQNFTYIAEFEHGSAQGEVQAVDAKQAKAKVKAMYHGQTRDTGTDEDGNPTTEDTAVTKVTVTPVKES